jgi:hypothetical protein
MPFNMRFVTPQFEIITIFTDVKFNAPLEEIKFTKPKQ